MLNLSALLGRINCTQSELARQVGVSMATISLAIRYDQWPRGRGRCGDEHQLKGRIHDYLVAHGVPQEDAATAFEEAPQRPRKRGSTVTAAAAAGIAANPSPDEGTSTIREDIDMLLRKHTISQDARDHFGLPRDPFTNEMRAVADVFQNDNFRRVRAAVRNTAQHGGMLAVIAESGAGKSTLRKDLAHWIKSSDQPVVLIEPYILGMEDNERKGRPLRAEDLVAAVIRRVSPGTAVRQTHQARSAQMHDLLRASAESGNRHVLVIEEAHRLARQTIRHFKGFYELDDGFTSLLSILLIGQTELDWKLGDNDFEVREVVQRLEKRYLEPLDNDIEAYLRFKFGRIDVAYDKVFEPGVADAILTRLRVSTETRIKGQRTLGPRSLCYPLAINNLVSGAVNLAYLAGEDKVSARLIPQVGREV